MPEDDKRASIAKDVCLRFLNMTAKTPGTPSRPRDSVNDGSLPVVIRTVYVGPEEPLNAEAFDEIILGTAAEILPRLLGPKVEQFVRGFCFPPILQI